MFDMSKACHSELRGGHFADKITTYIVLRTGYYWPTLFKDAKKFVISCDACQRMGRLVPSDEMPLQTQISIEPFMNWAIDFAGPISTMSRKKRNILVCTDYVTKWVEAKALYSVTEKMVVDFLFEEIFLDLVCPKRSSLTKACTSHLCCSKPSLNNIKSSAKIYCLPLPRKWAGEVYKQSVRIHYDQNHSASPYRLG